jgi:hypothetical protein
LRDHRPRFWLVIGFTGLFDTSCDYTLQVNVTRTHTCPQSRFHVCCSVAASNGRRFPSSGFPNCLCHQLPASNTNSSQRLNSSNSLTDCNSSQVKVTLRLMVSQSVSCSVEPHLGLVSRYLILFDCYGLVFYRAPSLTRGRVYLLYMVQALASSVFLGSESLGTRDHILLSQIWDFPFRRLLRLAGTDCNCYLVQVITSQHGPCSEYLFHYLCVLLLPWKHACFQTYYLLVAVV